MKSILSALFFISLFQVACLPKNDQPPSNMEELSFAETYSPPQANDPYQVHQWRLKNGLTVYFSQNKEQPNFYSQIVVRAGGAQDPADATGLAHYLEHLLFKGTKKLGTLNSEEEQKYQQQIEKLYLDLFDEKDPDKRNRILKEIDIVSVKSAEYVAFNELDSLYTQLGATLLNAHTSFDETVYKVQMPKNRFEVWAQVEAERFSDPVFRLFQWELETVYEEKNRSMDNPGKRIFETLLSHLWAGHPYGDQTIIGTLEHLKNPPLHKVREFFDTYYVPNNMAIVLSGDLEPDQVIKVIKEHFSHWKAKNVDERKLESVPLLTKKVERQLLGPGDPSVNMAFQVGNALSADLPEMEVFSLMVQKRLEELVINQWLKNAGIYFSTYNYGGLLFIQANPLPGQPLDEVEALIMRTLQEFKQGQFPEELMTGAKLSAKASIEISLEGNNMRVGAITETFIRKQTWQQNLNLLPSILTVNREDIVKYANKYIGDKYVVVDYETGDFSPPVVEKPKFTLLTGQNSANSAFYQEVITNSQQQKAIEFAPYGTMSLVQELDIQPGVVLFHTLNPYNNQAQLIVEYLVNPLQNKFTCVWVDYLNKASTQDQTVQDLRRKLYSQGIDFSLYCTRNNISLTIQGEEKYMMDSLQQISNFLNQATASESLLSRVVEIEVDTRKNNLTLPKKVSAILYDYLKNGLYSDTQIFANNNELLELKITDLDLFRQQMNTSQKKIFYIGRQGAESIKNELVNLIEKAQSASSPYKYPSQRSLSRSNGKNMVYLLHVSGMSQTHLYGLRNLFAYNANDIDAYNSAYFHSYFLGDGMSSPFLKEIREKRALAYATSFDLLDPYRGGDEIIVKAFVGTQTDKLAEAFQTSRDIIDNYQMNPQEFHAAQNGLQELLTSSRPYFRDLPSRYEKMKRLNLEDDITNTFYSFLSKTSSDELVRFSQENIAKRPFVYGIVGDKTKMDLSFIPADLELVELQIGDLVNY